MEDCKKVFIRCITSLVERLKAQKEEEPLIWDKDDDPAMDFVTACSNFRCYIFGITQKSRFNTKC